MFKFFRDLRTLVHEIGELYDLFISGNYDVIHEPVKLEIGKDRVMEPSSSMSGATLKMAVELKALTIYEQSKGTPTEYYEHEALGMILDEKNGYHIKPQIKRVQVICDYVGSGKKVLDCAGGGGYIANLIRNQGNDVTVMDYSRVHLLRAKWLRKLKTAHGRAESLPFPDHSFDVVIMAEVLEHCERMSNPLAEAERVCKEDGQIIITIPVCAKQDEYGEHLKSIRQTFIDDETHNNEMLVLSIRNILPHLKEFRDRGRDFKVGETKQKYGIDGLKNLVIRGMHGLGDNIGQRNFIKELPFPVYLETPWPQLYSDLPNIKLIECDSYWRTQKKNLSINTFPWADLPQDRGPEIQVGYNNEDLQGEGSIFKKLSDTFGGIVPRTFDMPQFKRPDRALPKNRNGAPTYLGNYVVIRPTIQRKEWFSTSRNPDPQYIYRASELLKSEGYFVISVCDLENEQEWIEGKEPIANLKFHHGELSVEELLGLVQNAGLLVGSPGWMVHASLASKVPMALIYGGYGGCNAPEKIADSRYADTSCLTHFVPDNFCLDQNMGCKTCDKTIYDFDSKFITWIKSVSKHQK